MLKIRLISFLVSSLFVSGLSHAQCLKDHRANKTSGVLVREFNILGTRTVGSDELSSITSELIGSCFNDDSEEMGEWIRNSFQNRGYFVASIKNVHIKADDPLRVPKPVAIEAEVQEGPRCVYGQIRFTGNHAFASDKLLAEFPVKNGDLFERSKIGTGLAKVIKLYVADGYLDITMVPNSRIVGERIDFTIDVEEGSQFRMGKLQIFAKAEQADKLRAAWGISEGTVFDESYLEKYIEKKSASATVTFYSRFRPTHSR